MTFALHVCPAGRSGPRASRRLQVHCHQVLFNQLISWVGYGTLVDPQREFFIQSTGAHDGGISGAGPGMVAGAVRAEAVDSVAAEHAWNTQCVTTPRHLAPLSVHLAWRCFALSVCSRHVGPRCRCPWLAGTP